MPVALGTLVYDAESGDLLADICRRVKEFGGDNLPFERDRDALEARVRQVEAVIAGRRSGAN